ncbi:hypothetical protein JDV02_000290 [Purpureocillium takamizusanense]|uniref:Uncharacterized protein n=1 Tax=Purpureocillium takamizusanense TaxID=2060973 RepID=A0A9Q8Q727_9HYPO|nr:uncharacterized protein JDV02_000290 [Purpureocillium takamizusanense]UNI13558.1 hypothetical protein JDV02_000290 [Purpureocillium takamizusanense]
MQWQILDRFRNYTDPWRPLSYAVWAVYATARDALLGGRGSGAARSPASFKESAFYLWFKTINHHFIEIESTRTPVPQLVPQASGLVLELGPGMGNQLRRFDKSKLTRVVGVESNAHFAPDILLEVKERGLEDVCCARCPIPRPRCGSCTACSSPAAGSSFGSTTAAPTGSRWPCSIYGTQSGANSSAAT